MALSNKIRNKIFILNELKIITFQNILPHLDVISRVMAWTTIFMELVVAILILWNKVEVLKKMKLIPPALVAVIVSILLNEFFPFHFFTMVGRY